MVPFAKCLICIVALILLPLLAGTVDRAEEARIASGRGVFNPLRSNRAEFYSFFLFSITGLLLVASADDLIWLFLALELTSLPTYVMVAISSSRHRPTMAAACWGSSSSTAMLSIVAAPWGSGTGRCPISQAPAMAAGGYCSL